MPNIHLQTAARNVRQAANDVLLKSQQEKAGSDKRINEMKKRLNEIKNEERLYMTQAASADTDAQRAHQSNQIQDLERETNEINKKIAQENDQIRKIQSDLEGQRMEFNELASDLESRA